MSFKLYPNVSDAIEIRILSALASVEASAWDNLIGSDDPFVEHAFLSTLEDSGSIGMGTGWVPMHLTAWKNSTLIGALPLYLKDHSYGEYIFDWSWADAAAHLGASYYPKLIAMIPLTPTTGRRFLYAPQEDPTVVVSALLSGCLEVAHATDASSIHLLFLNSKERNWVARDSRFMSRLSFQFHWSNQDYQCFDDFLISFRSSMRKKLRKERRVAAETGLQIETLGGTEISLEDWRTLSLLYRSTCSRKGSYPYLTEEFFELAAERLPETAVLCAAREDARIVAASINFEKGKCLYGRYWGASDRNDMLHFELCYYKLIERAITKRMVRFEAGAQGTHKLRRGLMPAPIYSAHWIRHPVLRSAVERFLLHEARETEEQIQLLSDHGPFHRDVLE